MWRIGLAFLCGDCFVQLLPQLPSRAWVFVAFSVLAAIGLTPSRVRRCIVALVFGVLWAWLRAAQVQSDSLDPAIEGHDVWVEGWIASLPDNSEADSQFVFDVAHPAPGIPSRIRLAWYRTNLQLRPGAHWRFHVRLKRRNGFQNPGGFDYEAMLFSQGIGATGYVREDQRNLKLDDAARRYGVETIRYRIAESMALALPNSPMLGVLQGLAVGDTRQISSQQWQVFATTGTTHLMAISGLHITMIAGLLAALGRLAARLPRAQARGLTAIHGEVAGGLVGAIAYSLLAGLSVPTQRTLIMLCIYFGARILRRELSLANGLSIALLGVLIVDPFAPLTPGAWLSFGAVAVIGACAGGRLRREGTIRAFSRVQWVVTLGLVPFIVLSFGALSLVSPLANAVAVPLFTFLVVPLSLVGALCASIHQALGFPFLQLASWLLELCWPGLVWVSELPLAQWHFASPSGWQLLALVAGTLLLISPGIAPMRCAGLLLCVPATFSAGPSIDARAFELTVLDVGQGLASVVRTRSHVLVFDTGPAFRSGRDAAQLAVLPYLYAMGVRKLDMLVVSHDDMDHRGGMDSLLRQMPVGESRLGPSVRGANPVQRCRRGQHWTWDGVQFEFIHPGEDALAAENESSCVLLVSTGAHRVLLTGDIQDQAEASIVEHGLVNVSAVVAPHHGSATSSTAEFVNALAPQFVIFSTGYLNRWGFPKPSVVARWRAAGAMTFDTAKAGAITLSVDPRKELQIDEYRKSHRRYWLRIS
ncbi:MAG TPA: DNA internalization-related competence protein ComEC/Rec2 [Steroidobacteraceae bacterium]|nr:DNA internalization-related competence protein ComEC/Rec2 [Steroidobacteraceae bacterium]